MSTFVAFIQTPQSTRVLGEIDAHDALAAMDVARKWYAADAGPWPVCIKTAPAQLPDPSRRNYWIEAPTDRKHNIDRFRAWKHAQSSAGRALLLEARIRIDRDRSSHLNLLGLGCRHRKEMIQLLAIPVEIEWERPADPTVHDLQTDTLEEDARDSSLEEATRS